MGKVTGTVVWDAADPAKSKVEATIDVAGINTRDEKRDAHLRSADFFDVAQFPTMTFVSKKVEPAGPGKLKVTGDLTMRGVTKTVVLDVEGPAEGLKSPNGSIRSGAVATTKLNRQDFGVKWSRTLDTGGVAVGDEVSVTIDIEMVSGGAAR
jgi:polyisoprenoid-binding protein YceI